MKRLFILSVFILVSMTVLGQSAVVPAGGTATGSGGTVTYTVGQIADQKVEGSGTYIIEGVQQPYDIQVIGVDNFPGIILEAIVYPNPTQYSLRLSIRNYQLPEGGLTAEIYDFNGRCIYKGVINNLETDFDFSRYAAATYHLRVLNDKSLLKTFKVVKTSL